MKNNKQLKFPEQDLDTSNYCFTQFSCHHFLLPERPPHPQRRNYDCLLSKVVVVVDCSKKAEAKLDVVFCRFKHENSFPLPPLDLFQKLFVLARASQFAIFFNFSVEKRGKHRAMERKLAKSGRGMENTGIGLG